MKIPLPDQHCIHLNLNQELSLIKVGFSQRIKTNQIRLDFNLFLQFENKLNFFTNVHIHMDELNDLSIRENYQVAVSTVLVPYSTVLFENWTAASILFRKNLDSRH